MQNKKLELRDKLKKLLKHYIDMEFKDLKYKKAYEEIVACIVMMSNTSWESCYDTLAECISFYESDVLEFNGKNKEIREKFLNELKELQQWMHYTK